MNKHTDYNQPSRLKKLSKVLTPLISLLVLAFAIHLLSKHLGQLRYDDIIKDLRAIPLSAIWMGIAISILNYFILGLLEVVSHKYAATQLKWWRSLCVGSFSYALINTIGFSSLFGTALRYRYYSRWKIEMVKFFKAVSFAWFSYWLGMGVIIVGVFVVSPGTLKATLADHPSVKFSTLIIFILILLYYAAVLRQKKLTFGSFTITPPSRPIALAQTLLGMADWITAGAVLFVMLPDGSVSIFTFFKVFMLAQAFGLASHIPAGLGVFESIMLTGLQGQLPPSEIVASIAAYRVIYYFIPLGLAGVVMTLDELRRLRAQLRKLRRSSITESRTDCFPDIIE